MSKAFLTPITVPSGATGTQVPQKGEIDTLLATKQATLGTASSTVSGILSSTDWATFNGKQAAGAYAPIASPTFTGIVTAPQITDVFQAPGNIRNNLGNPSVEESALFHGEFNNKFRFIGASYQEESTDGIAWTTSTRATTNTLADIMLGEGQSSNIVAIPTATIGVYGGYRLTWNVVATTGYIYLNHLYIYNSTNGNTVTILVDALHNTNGWTTIATGVVSNWPGHTTLKHSTVPYSAAAAQYSQVRVTFSTLHNSNINGFNIYGMEWFGGYPAGRRNVEYYDRTKNVYFPASITGISLVSTVAVGTAPLVVTSTTAVTNLNADLLDGNHAAAFYLATNPSGYTANTGTVTGVTATAPVTSSGGTAPVIAMAAATTTVPGYLTAADWTTFNGKQAAGTYATGGGSATGSNTGDQTIPTTLPNANAVTFTTTGGAAAGSTYTGAAILTVDYATVGAAASGHTHSYQAADADLLAIGGLTGTSGYLKKTAADTWTLDTSTFATGGGSATGTNTGDNSANTTYASDYRAANFVAGTNYLAPTGSAASLTSFPTLNQNTTGSSSRIGFSDRRSTVQTPAQFGAGADWSFMTNTTDGLVDGGTYHGIMHYQPYGDATGGGAYELGFTDNNNLWLRGSSGALTTWAAWKQLAFTSSNITGTAAGLSATLAIASGGTNSTAAPTAGGIGYGTGTAHAYTAAGTAGQVLTSNNGGVPTWTTPTTGVTVATQRTFTTATAAQTVFTAPAYIIGGKQLQVFINGVRQFDTAYTETSTTSFTLTSGATVGDIILAEVYGSTTVATTATVTSFTPTGTISSTTVQAAIAEVSTATGTKVTSVTATAPVTSSGGTAPVIAMAAATTSVPGYLTAADWTTFNGKYSTGGGLGTPSSGTLTNCTFPTLNQNTTGTSGGLTGTPAITVGIITATGANITGTTNVSPLIVQSLSSGNSSIRARTGSASTTSFSVLQNGAYNYIATGTYYNGSTWLYDQVGGASLLAIHETTGVDWHCGTGASYSSIASAVKLWDASGIWKNSVSTTGTIAGSNITSGGDVTGSSASCTGTAYLASAVSYLPNRTDAAAYQVVWGAPYTSGSGTIAYSCAAVTITSSTGQLSAGILYSSGNVTAYSDERVKANWRPVSNNFIEQLAEVKSGIYDRTDCELTQAGVSAQSWKKVLPETVCENEEGHLSVVYGHAALVSAVELAKELVALKELVKELKAEVDDLKSRLPA